MMRDQDIPDKQLPCSQCQPIVPTRPPEEEHKPILQQKNTGHVRLNLFAIYM